MFPKFLAFLGMVLLFACNSRQVTLQNERPGWIDQPGMDYPESDYITAVGSAANPNDAQNAALGNLAKVFSVQIRVDETLINRYAEHAGKLSASALLIGKTDTKSIQNLKNIRIARTYYSASEGLYFALALLDRKETARIYLNEISENNTKIKADYAQFQTITKPLKRIRYLSRAAQTAAINEVLAERYKIITGGKRAPLTFDSRKLNDIQTQERAKITVSVISETEKGPEIKKYFKDLISKLGLKISDHSSELQIRYQFTTEPVNLNRPNMVALQWNISGTLFEQGGEEAEQTFLFGKRTVSINQEQVKVRMMRDIQKWINTQLNQKIQKFLNL